MSAAGLSRKEVAYFFSGNAPYRATDYGFLRLGVRETYVDVAALFLWIDYHIHVSHLI